MNLELRWNGEPRREPEGRSAEGESQLQIGRTVTRNRLTDCTKAPTQAGYGWGIQNRPPYLAAIGCTADVFAATLMPRCDPNVWCGRALQEIFVDLLALGLASMYPASDWSVCSGPPWISARLRSSGQASTGPFGSPPRAPAFPGHALTAPSTVPRFKQLGTPSYSSWWIRICVPC